MSKQIFCLSKGLKSNIIFILSAAAIMLFGFAIILPAVPEKTHAEGDSPNEGIIITISPEINASLLSSENGDYKIVKDTVTIGTDALNGYTLYISTDTPQHQTLYLNGDTSSENKISGTTGTYESPKALGDYEWGFAVPGIGHFDASYDTETPSDTAKFAILPTENKIIRDYTTATSEDAAEVYYGFKLGGTIEPGDYETDITYTAIPATQPLTAKAVLGNNGNLNFLYDRNTYTVGQSYTDNLEETIIAHIYDVPVNSSYDNKPIWEQDRASIYSANFDSSFYNFKPTSTAYWFYSERYLRTVTNANNLDTSDVTDMSWMFSDAGYNSYTFTMDASSWNTSKVTNMHNMFSGNGYDAGDWTVGDLGGWDTSSVTNMTQAFFCAGWNALFWTVGDISSWDTSNVTSMSYMFYSSGSHAFTWGVGDISGWNVENVGSHAGFVNWNQTNIDTSKLPWQSDN